MRFFLPLMLCLVGCVSADRQRLEDALRMAPVADTVARERYVLTCPDRVQITWTGQPGWNVEPAIGVDGRVTLPGVGPVRVQGQTPQEARRTIARALNCPPEEVRIQVKEHLSQQIFIHGLVAGDDRAIAYQGPETILDVLRRGGGLEPSASLTGVGIVRGHVAEGRSPEFFEVDLKAIVLDNNPAANIRVEPFDQIYIGPSRRAEFVSSMPRVLRPTWAALLGIRHGRHSPGELPLR